MSFCRSCETDSIDPAGAQWDLLVDQLPGDRALARPGLSRDERRGPLCELMDVAVGGHFQH